VPDEVLLEPPRKTFVKQNRISGHGLAGGVQNSGHLFSGYRRKVLEEVIHPVTRLQVVHQRVDGNPSTREDWHSGEDLRIYDYL
jgi:hypothetical protein